MFGGAGMFGLYALGALTACVILALATAMTGWLAALIVTAIYGAIAGVLALTGKEQGQAGCSARTRADRREREGGRGMDEAASEGRPAVSAAAGEGRQKTPEEIEAEIEQTREELGDTVEALAGKVRPSRRRPRTRSLRSGIPPSTRRTSSPREHAKLPPTPPAPGPAARLDGPAQAGAVRRRRRVRRRGARRLDPAPSVGIAMREQQHLREVDQTARSAEPDQPTELPRGPGRGCSSARCASTRPTTSGDLAAALTYYGVLAIFPMLIVVVSLLGLLGHSVTQSLIQNLGKAAPSDARQIFTSAIQNIQSHRSTAGILFIVGLVLALWSASGYIAAFMRASNVVWDVEEGRPIWTTIPLRLAVTLVTVVLLTVTAAAVVLTGGLAEQLGNVIGVGHSAVTIWDIAKWPVLLLVVAVHPGDPLLGRRRTCANRASVG